MTFGFQNQLKTGKRGEQLFYMVNVHLVPTDGRKGDFIDPLTGAVWELKTDTYPMSKTPNFFIERYSNAAKRSPGGPWQAKGHGCKYFVYFYENSGCYFIFDTVRLVRALNKMFSDHVTTSVGNRGYFTEGYKVPRKALLAIADKVVFSPLLLKERKSYDNPGC